MGKKAKESGVTMIKRRGTYGPEDVIYHLGNIAMKLDAIAELVCPDECENAPVLYARMELMETGVLAMAQDARRILEEFTPSGDGATA